MKSVSTGQGGSGLLERFAWVRNLPEIECMRKGNLPGRCGFPNRKGLCPGNHMFTHSRQWSSITGQEVLFPVPVESQCNHDGQFDSAPGRSTDGGSWPSFAWFSGSPWSFPVPGAVHGQSLRGSASSLDRQERAAQTHDFTYLQSPAQVESFVKAGYLVQVRPNRDFDLHGVSYPFARPEVRTFVLRLVQPVPKGVWRTAGGDEPHPAPFPPTPKRLRPVGSPHRDGPRHTAQQQPELPVLAGRRPPLPGGLRGFGGHPGKLSAPLPHRRISPTLCPVR